MWATTTGTSEDLLTGVKVLVETMEGKHEDRLKEWDGAPIPDLNENLEKALVVLKDSVGSHADDDIDVHELGFDILKAPEVSKYVGQLEDAYNLYCLTGDLQTAHDLAISAAETIEQQDPQSKESSLFHALGAKVLVQIKGVSPECLDALEKAEKIAQEQENEIAMAEVSEAFAHYYTRANDNSKARDYCTEAKDHMNEVGLANTRDLNRLINFELAEINTYIYEDKYDEAITIWKEVAALLDQKSAFEGVSDVDGVMLAKHTISVNNNIGFTSTLQDKMDTTLYEYAIPYLEKSMQAVDETNARWYIPIVKGNLGMAYAFVGDFEKGSKYINEAYKIAKELKNTHRIAIVERDLGIFHFRRGVEANSKKDLYKAMYRFFMALDKQTSEGEQNYIKFFMRECEQELKKRIR